MTLTVLLQHRRPQTRDMAAMVLSDAGYQVHLSLDGAEGLRRLATLRPDAIITGINMPQLDGFGFIEAVRRLDHMRAVPILVLSANGSPELKTRARNIGASGWLSDPIAGPRLLATVKAVVGGHGAG